ncbi:MAG: phosphopantothenoylcysteine decarboxylase [Planctomycetota bacterium]
MTERTENPYKLLITAGPTHEPIDAVRYIGNRSSGTLGVALADEAAGQGWDVTLLLGPTNKSPLHAGVRVERFQTTAELESLLATFFPRCDALVMAAAVADYRPRLTEVDLDGKRRRTGEQVHLELEPTPDLVGGCAAQRKPGQTLVAFALEPRDEMLDSARRKLDRKGVDVVIANPLETMDASDIEAHAVVADTSPLAPGRTTNGVIPKTAFAGWLLDVIDELMSETAANTGPRGAAGA